MASNNEIAGWMLKEIDEMMEEDIAIVSKICEDAVGIAREEHIYQAQTGNLQSSVGFAITYNGEQVMRSDFVAKPGENNPDGQTGADKGEQWLDECLQERLGNGIQAVMVAGMDYAGYVEDKGLDVLKSAEAHVRQEIDKFAKGLI